MKTSRITLTNAKYSFRRAKFAHRPGPSLLYKRTLHFRVAAGWAGAGASERAVYRRNEEGREGEGERRQPAAPSCAPSSSSGPPLRPSVRLCCEIGSSGFVFPRLRSAAAATAAAEEEDYSTATHYAAEFVCLSGDRLRDLWRNIPRQYHVRLA